MKKQSLVTLWILSLLGPALLMAQSEHSQHSQQSPYVDLQQRDIKALSQEEVDSLLNGDGMGFALAAELNHYPGPKHVLEMKEKIGLTADQEKRVEESFERMQASARDLGRKIVDAERSLDRGFQTGDLKDKTLQESVTAIGVLQGQLRGVHLSAHLEMRRLLTHEQIMAYVQTRGYAHHPGNQ